MDLFLVVINGESFRYGGQFSRTRGIEDSYERQYVATESHIKLIKYIEEKYSLRGEVFLSTYTLGEKWDNDLRQWYKPYLVGDDFRDTIANSEVDFRNYNIDLVDKFIQKTHRVYKFILFIRLDYYLKKYFFEVFQAPENKVLFGFIDSFTTNEQLFPCVMHSIAYVPSIFYSLLFSMSFYSMHNSGHFLLKHTSEDHIGFFSNSCHITTSDLEWNPIFVCVGRIECLESTSKKRKYVDGKYIDQDIDFCQSIFKETFQEALQRYKETIYAQSVLPK